MPENCPYFELHNPIYNSVIIETFNYNLFSYLLFRSKVKLPSVVFFTKRTTLELKTGKRDLFKDVWNFSQSLVQNQQKTKTWNAKMKQFIRIKTTLCESRLADKQKLQRFVDTLLQEKSHFYSGFSSRNDLHLIKKPFTCSICSHSFARKHYSNRSWRGKSDKNIERNSC